MLNASKDLDLISVNPAEGQRIQSYDAFSSSKVHKIIDGSCAVWEDWRLNSFLKRAKLLENLSETLLKERERLSEMITEEMGKPLNQSVREIEKCALLCRYYREYGEYFLTPREEHLQYKKSYIYYAPLGGILGIMPWNFPFWQVFRYAIPALTAGNAVFLKHSENVTKCALALENIFHTSGWPAGLFNTLLLKRGQVESVIAHPFIKSVSFTGSTKTGRHIASLCGAYLKKSILELGGNDSYIVLEDADLEKAATNIIDSRLNNSGQSCIAAKRVIAEKGIYGDLIQILIKILHQKNISHPLYNPDVGPLAKKEFVKKLEDIRDQDVKDGAQILFEKYPRPEDQQKGYYFPITLLGNCNLHMRCFREETFGPLLPIFKAENEQDAIKWANDTLYGLGAVIFTENRERGEKWAKDHIDAGSCFVNGLVQSSPYLPFGGIKESGYGRELSIEGLREFTNVKTIVICR